MPSPRLVALGVCSVLLGAARPAAALDHEFQTWSSFVSQTQVGERLELWFDAHARRRSTSTLLAVRPGLGYRWLPRLATHVGYGWIPTFSDAGGAVHEHRLWEQLVWSTPLPNGFGLLLRPRIEQRMVEGEPDVGHRLRAFVRGSWSPRPDANWLLVFSNEAFFGFNQTSWGAPSGFDQNRAFAGLGLPSRSGVRFECGYLNVYFNRAPGQMVHGLSINAFLVL